MRPSIEPKTSGSRSCRHTSHGDRLSVNQLRRANPYLTSRQLRAGDNLFIPE